MGRITVGVVGVTFKNQDGSSRQDILGRLYDDYWTEGRERELRIALVADHGNQYDACAVMVVVEAPEVVKGQIGYLPRDHAKVLQGKLSMVREVRLHHMSSVRRTVGVTIRIFVRSVIEDDEGRAYEFS